MPKLRPVLVGGALATLAATSGCGDSVVDCIDTFWYEGEKFTVVLDEPLKSAVLTEPVLGVVEVRVNECNHDGGVQPDGEATNLPVGTELFVVRHADSTYLIAQNPERLVFGSESESP